MEYQRLDRFASAMYRNQFNSPLDATALLGDKIQIGYDDLMWSEAKYVGSALTDASIVLAMVTNDWEELGLTYLTTNFTDWAQGKYSWPHHTAMDMPADVNIPRIGCNTDRMAHVPKGVALESGHSMRCHGRNATL